MADISMCSNQECKLRETCYRANAKIGMWQSWAMFEPDSDTQCEYWIAFDEKGKPDGK